MMKPHFFGTPERRLYGGLHETTGQARAAVLVCPPLMQDYARTHRALWALGEQLARADVAVLRFDYFGSGDSGGASTELTLDSALADIGEAYRHLLESSGLARAHVLGMRSGALLGLAFAARCGFPLDLLLWDARLDGDATVAGWRSQHLRQSLSGRYQRLRTAAPADELLGLPHAPALLDDFAALSGAELAPADGSRLVFANWDDDRARIDYAARLRARGLQVTDVALSADVPNWEGVENFEVMAFPRKSIRDIAAIILGIIA